MDEGDAVAEAKALLGFDGKKVRPERVFRSYGEWISGEPPAEWLAYRVLERHNRDLLYDYPFASNRLVYPLPRRDL